MIFGESKLDSHQSAFFSRQLEALKAKTYDVEYPDLLGRQYIPVDNSAGSGAKTVTYRQWDQHGNAKLIADNAKDVPRVDVDAEEFSKPVRTAAASYGWNLNEIRQAARAQVDLNGRRASAARRAVELLLEDVAFSGAPSFGIATGFGNDTVITQDTAAAAWSAATADQILSDVSGMVQGILSDTMQLHSPDTLLLPVADYARILTLPRSTTSDTTVLSYLRQNFGISTIAPWYRMDTADAGSPRGILYKRSPDIVTQDIVSEFEQLPAQEQGLEFVVNTMASTAGTSWYYPRAARYLDGI